MTRIRRAGSTGAGSAALVIVGVILTAFTKIAESVGRLTTDVATIIALISTAVVIILLISKVLWAIQRKRVRSREMSVE